MRLYHFFVGLILCMLSAVPASALTSTFTADFSAGCSPLVVHFHPTDAACAGCTYSWNFGTGSPVTTYLASSSFISVGTHVVTLTVSNGTTTTTTSMTITVYPSPTVSFVADDTAVCPGSPVTFTSTSTGGVPGPMTYSWNYGDGGTGTGSPSTHVYSTSGYYNVTLVVTNAQGCTASLTKTAYIHVYNAPVPNFTADVVAICNPPGTVTFTDASSGAGPFTYAWTFGDGGTSGATDPSHPYSTPGTYNVKLVITDANGCKDSVTRTGYIYVGNLHASFTFTDNICQYGTATFTNTSSTHTTRTWDYGDGSPTDPSVNGTHAYSSTGTYTVTLTIHNGPCTDVITHIIHVIAGPPGTFTINPSEPCPAPSPITVTSTGPLGTLTNWVFGPGGGSGTGTPTTYTYGSNGTKTISMIMTDPVTGCKDTVTQTIIIYDLTFTAAATPPSGCVPLTVAFSGSATTTEPTGIIAPYPYPLTSYSWDFGDGSTPGTGPTPSHTYTAVGTYWATVTAMTANGCPVSYVVKILVGAPPQVTFTATPTHACYNSSTFIYFTATVVVGPVDDYEWNFGDGGGSDTDGLHTHIYTLPGVWTVTVTPYYHGCPGPAFVRTDYITIDSPKAIISSVFACTPPTRVTFGDSSLGDDTHLWTFGDGFTSTLDNPIHDYPALAPYTVKLTTYNVRSGCRDTASQLINLVKPIPDFTADVTSTCKYSSVTFTSTVTGGVASSYQWYLTTGPTFGIALPTPYVGPVLTYEFYTPGIYSVRLIITDEHGCPDTVTKNNYITIAKPVSLFTVAPTSGCWPLTVGFTDISTDVSGVSLTSYFWDFGDGGSSTVATATTSHTYTAAGTYNVTHIPLDNVGCRDTAVHTSAVSVYKPNPVFTASTVHPCENVPITFTNSSTGIVSSAWTFGDGGTSTVTSPVYSYSATGSYNVSLTVTDAHSCTATVTLPSYIGVTRPVAAFNMSDSVSVCAPLLVHFYNTSTGAISYAWTFGDGNTSVAASPTDFYTAPGLFNVRLIATNAYGCRDTALRPINIFGYAGAFSYTPLTGCSPLAVTFTAMLTNVPNIIWDFSDGTTSTVSSQDTITHIYTQPGAYIPKLILSDNTGCQNSSIGVDTIKVDQAIAKFTTFPNPVCLGTPFNFIDSSTSYWSTITSWTWTYDGNTSNVQSPSYTINTPGSYPVDLKVVDGWGCIAIADSNIVVYPLPVVTASRDTTICISDTATLFGYGASTYTWSPPGTLLCTACNPAKANPTTYTTYTVIGTDIHGCTDTASTSVGQRTLTIAGAWGDTAVCFGTPVQIFDTGGYFYNWYPPLGLSNNIIFNPIATPPYTTKYMVVARLGSCIPDTDFVLVTVYPLPTVDAGPDQRLLAGDPAQLNATGTLISTFAWTPAGTLSCADCANPVATMSVMTTYDVQVSTIHGCKASDSVKVLIYCDNSQIFVPNAFTPNGDGENDVFYPRGIGIKIVKSFRIYNRWGELLFERNNIDLNDATNAWDGSYKGSTPKPDVYVYIIDAVCFTGDPVFIKGDVTIIR